MSLIKKANGGIPVFRNLLSDFFDTEKFRMSDLLEREWYPAVNVSENEKSYTVELMVPGMKKEDFKIKVEDGIMSIAAEVESEKSEKDKNYTRKEYSFKSFSRSFTLPENAREEDIKANYENGVLKLAIAKKELSVNKAREISIK